MNDLMWDKGMILEFTNLACLTDDEIEVLKDLAHGKSIVHTAMRINVSESTVSNIRKRLRVKYDQVQPKSVLLPVRITRK